MARKAVPTKSKLRLVFAGIAGSGKSWSSLNVGTYFLERIKERGFLQGNGRIAVLDSDNGASTLYAKVNDEDDYGFDFDIEVIKDFSPLAYIDALFRLDNEGYSLIIVDTATPEWNGKGGTIERVGKITAASRSKNAFIAWPQVNPDHYEFVNFLKSLNAHLICNLFAKKKCIMEGNKVESIGVKSIQREDFEKEFHAIGMLNQRHEVKFNKGRYPLLDQKTFPTPGKDLGVILADWMLRGEGEPRTLETELPQKYIDEIKSLWKHLNYSDSALAKNIQKRGIASGRIQDLTYEAALDLVKALRDKACIATDTKTITDSLDRAAEQSSAVDDSPTSSALSNGELPALKVSS